MQTTDFDFTLSPELIARYPLEQRSASRLLALDRMTGAVTHHTFSDLPMLVQPGDLFVLNNTKVIPARLFGEKNTGGKIEVLIERMVDSHQALAHIKASKAPKPGGQLKFSHDIIVNVLQRQDDLFLLHFPAPVLDVIERIGHVPIPPYFQRDAEAIDKERYQTIFAEQSGAVAAPTAGLHFDERIFVTLKDRGIDTVCLTLHVGAGTFQPVRVDDIKNHHMHAEWIDVPMQACEKIQQTKAHGGRVIAVGTTVVRSLETAARSGTLKPFTGETDIFIYPGFQFHCVDAIITNFHLPQSTLLMLISAFAGRENILHAYHAAIAERYRFYSYGDAMLILADADHVI